jgi:hypothetical protein
MIVDQALFASFLSYPAILVAELYCAVVCCRVVVVVIVYCCYGPQKKSLNTRTGIRAHVLSLRNCSFRLVYLSFHQPSI